MKKNERNFEEALKNLIEIHERNNPHTDDEDDRRAHELGDVGDGSIGLELDGPLEGQDHAREDTGQDNDENGAHPDPVHVVDGFLDIPRSPEGPGCCDHAELREVLHGCGVAFEGVFDTGHGKVHGPFLS